MLEELESLVVSDSGMEFQAEAFQRLYGPIVYAFFDADSEPLYVGRSMVGVGRPLNIPKHHAMRGVEYASVKIWACPSKAATIKLEALMVRTMKPRLNQRLPDSAAWLQEQMQRMKGRVLRDA